MAVADLSDQTGRDRVPLALVVAIEPAPDRPLGPNRKGEQSFEPGSVRRRKRKRGSEDSWLAVVLQADHQARRLRLAREAVNEDVHCVKSPNFLPSTDVRSRVRLITFGYHTLDAANRQGIVQPDLSRIAILHLSDQLQQFVSRCPGQPLEPSPPLGESQPCGILASIDEDIECDQGYWRCRGHPRAITQ